MPYYSTSNARDPLYDRNEPSAKYYGQFRASEAKPPQSYYQPPQPANGGSNVNTNTPVTPPHPNPLLHDDEAFIKATESLLQKRKMTLLSRTKFMYSKMDPLERSQFAAAYSRRYQRMPMFPAADETVLQRWMRRIEEDFGDAFLQVVGHGDGVGLPQQQLQQQQQQLQQQHHQLKRQQHQQLEEQQPSYHQERQPPPSFNSNPNAQRPRITNNEHSSRQYRQSPPPIRQEHRDNYDEEHLVHSSRPASYSNRDGIPNNSHAPLPRRKDRRTKSPSRRHEFEPTQQAIDVANLTAAAPYTPTSILKKSRLGREPVAQIMEVLPPAAPSNVASSGIQFCVETPVHDASKYHARDCVCE
ncbi:hypothetical protein MHU86_2441 [Fragilaria crotonensis]|nr:hypothetical protein MHU86_2441 [Fragilaria crotonensis]